jgi:hypothetical protein
MSLKLTSSTICFIVSLVLGAVDGPARFGPSLRDLAGESLACETMLALFPDAEPPVQLQLVEALAWLGDRTALDTIAAFMQSETWPASATGAWTLGRLGAKEALPYLMKCAQDIENQAGSGAITAIGDIGDNSTANRILELVAHHPDAGSQYMEASIRVLVRFESPAGWQFIEKVACDPAYEFSPLANMFVKRRQEGRLQSVWSGEGRLPGQNPRTHSQADAFDTIRT